MLVSVALVLVSGPVPVHVPVPAPVHILLLLLLLLLSVLVLEVISEQKIHKKKREIVTEEKMTLKMEKVQDAQRQKGTKRERMEQ